MSDKLSSPSTASSVKSPGSSRTSASADEPYLTIKRQPPKYAYSNESFDVEVQLEVPKTASPPSLSGFQFEIVPVLYNEKTGTECGSEVLLVTEPSRVVLKAGSDSERKCSIRCMIRMDSIRRDQGASLELRFGPASDSSPSGRSIASVATSPVNMVNYKLKISMEEEWGPIWYKDEGGRDKSMEVFASICDKEGQLKTGEQIPLHPILCYATTGATPVPVSNQEILRTLGASRIVIDKDTGKARVRFRVEDVSKNHQAQDFVLQVGTDPKSKSFKDVAPAYTPAVNVRSKRNKRSRQQSGGRSSMDTIGRPSPIPGRSRMGYDDQHDAAVFDPTDIPRLREAMKSVINWSDEVVNGLYPLQWQVLGYAQHPDGTADYSRPYHNMPNPNPFISRLLGNYSDTVRESLRILMNAIEQASQRSDVGHSYMPMPMAAPVPRPPVDDMYGMMRSPMQPMHHGTPGIPPHGMPVRHGMMSGPDVYRDKPLEQPLYQARGALPPMHQAGSPAMHQMHGYLRPPPQEGEMMPIHHHGVPPRQEAPPMQSSVDVQMRGIREEESRESEVEYVLAKHYKALRTGERLGFPAYSADKEILGFYRESSGKVGVGQFSPIARHRNDFGPLEIMQATEILEDAIAKKSGAVHSLKDWGGSIANLLDHALVYDWSKDISPEASAPVNPN